MITTCKADHNKNTIQKSLSKTPIQGQYIEYELQQISRYLTNLFRMLDLLTGYEGEFVTEDSLLTALQVER